jgi:hypothetical protein
MDADAVFSTPGLVLFLKVPHDTMLMDVIYPERPARYSPVSILQIR